MDMQLPLDRLNRRAWAERDACREFTREAAWTDAGEQAAFARIARECRGQPLLDIGMGAGRTVPLMMQMSSDYTGIDSTSSLLELSHKRFPGVNLLQMDAREMSALPGEHYALAAFGSNGIDGVAYEERVRVLREMHRVTRSGGLVFFSTHNRGGPGFDERPWQLLPRFSANPLRYGPRVLRAARRLPLALWNYRRNVRLHRDYEGYSIRTAAAQDFGMVIVYTTLAGQRRQLDALGFEVEAVYGSSEGDPIAPTQETSDARWLHFIARKVA
ncbi:class I SAM-dependent methyltransferase [Paraburkholderia pallida]|uniref:Class I SAM-dependent methyltransferase n=1 Tax=Paraburkholderia pallida TaxID=2547399 RepID=A0A4P7CUJ9_9BURK|nr:class I SAM-dependent methyltransferase [Paraburkholderia pallida]QBQ98396.1 class I SAM-dependent methyltransferase [Paraburkholderia pallida]